MLKNKLILLFLLLALFLCSGCWDHHELDEITLISGAAFDLAKSKDNISLTAQIIDVGAIATGGKAGEGDSFWNISSEGKTVFDAVRNCTHQSPRKLFWGHSQVIIFSQELSQKGIKEYIDFFLRDPESRNTAWIIVSEEKADEILNVKTRLENIPAMNLAQLVQGRSATSFSVGVDLQEFATRILSKTTAPVASFIKIINDGKEKKLFLTGTAVFNNDLEMVGKLNEQETRGLLWVLGEVKSGIIVIESPDCTGKTSLEIIKASSKIQAEIKGENLKIIIKVKETGNLGEDNCSKDILDPKVWKNLEKNKAAVIHKEIMLALNKARELNTDIFGFGDTISKKYPRQWKELEPRWEEIFPSLEVEVSVESKLNLSGMTLQAIK